MFRQLIEYLRPAKILILGFGREGRSTYGIIRRNLPEKRIGIADMKNIELDDDKADLYCGENYLEAIEDYDVIIKTPGISFRDVMVSKDKEITCQTDLFMRFSDRMVVGVTGTKGKTTVSTLIYEAAKRAGKEVCLIGNMGVPVLDSLEKGTAETAVVEASSHQLEYTSVSPRIAVMTNLYPEHLDHYNGFASYAAAKMNVARRQVRGDYFICNAEQDFSEYFNFSKALSTVIKVCANGGAGDEAIIAAAAANGRLMGAHNRFNVCLAATAARCLGGVSEADILAAVKEFKGIEHRMEPFGEYYGIKFIDDAIATIPRATECAVDAVEDLETLIFGGLDRGVDYSEFETYLGNSKLKNLIGLPDSGVKICENLLKKDLGKNIIAAQNLEEAVDAAFRLTQKGKSCIMSPAAASYNAFKNFEEKGNRFKELARNWRK